MTASRTVPSIGVAVVHYSPLKERQVTLANLLRELSFESIWVTEKECTKSYQFERTLFGVSKRKMFLDRSNNSRALVKPRAIARIEGLLLFVLSFITKRKLGWLTSNELLVTEKEKILEVSEMHLQAISACLAKQWEWFLVIEDDAVFDAGELQTFLSLFAQEVTKTSKYGGAWISISSGAEMKRTRFDGPLDHLNLFRVRPWATRCASGYLIPRGLAQNLINLFDNYGVPDWAAIDVVFQICLRKLKIPCFWQEPPLIKQGSEEGNYESSLKS